MFKINAHDYVVTLEDDLEPSRDFLVWHTHMRPLLLKKKEFFAVLSHPHGPVHDCAFIGAPPAQALALAPLLLLLILLLFLFLLLLLFHTLCPHITSQHSSCTQQSASPPPPSSPLINSLQSPATPPPLHCVSRPLPASSSRRCAPSPQSSPLATTTMPSSLFLRLSLPPPSNHFPLICRNSVFCSTNGITLTGPIAFALSPPPTIRSLLNHRPPAPRIISFTQSLPSQELPTNPSLPLGHAAHTRF